MKTVLILGATGMLGNAVGAYFQNKPEYQVFLTTRDLKFAYGPKRQWLRFDPTGKTDGAASEIKEVFEAMPANPDFVINCIGAKKAMSAKNEMDSIYINSLFPHQLALTCDVLGVKMITVASGCVYSGRKGDYVESDMHDALDAYGKSKSLGEPVKLCQVIRTAIVGDEIKDHVSLVAWVKSQANKEINGFTNHAWNGVTSKQFATVCDQIMTGDLYERGLFHVHSDVITEYDLLTLINDKYALGCAVRPVLAGEMVDRTLQTEKALMGKLNIPSLKDQIADL